MTPAAFWAAVRAAGPWWIQPHGKVRNQRGQCPLWAAAEINPATPHRTTEAIRRLGLDAAVGDNIWLASDIPSDPHRPLLLRELGLA